ncbi:MAG TPA: GNAT family N-acetyltransferase [Phnomibacter sp.]|nr:GNAT family N-acetyltransferase [Phnomibacter sp.]
MSISLLRTDSSHPDFIALVRQLDADLAIRDGDEHAFYAQFNKIDKIKHALVAYNESHEPIGCGAIKAFSSDAMEVKRMWVVPAFRGKGIASEILKALEDWARELGYRRCVLETGKKQVEAMHLYPKNGYQLIPNYGQYIGIENSVCFEKRL